MIVNLYEILIKKSTQMKLPPIFSDESIYASDSLPCKGEKSLHTSLKKLILFPVHKIFFACDLLINDGTIESLT